MLKTTWKYNLPELSNDLLSLWLLFKTVFALEAEELLSVRLGSDDLVSYSRVRTCTFGTSFFELIFSSSLL